MKTYLIFPDLHLPMHDPVAFSCALQAIRVVKPDGFVCLGDVGDWKSVSHWEWKRRKKPPLEFLVPLIEADKAWVNWGLDLIDAELDKVECEERKITLGNHENWLVDFVKEYPYMQKRFLPQNIMRLKERGWEWFDYGEYIKLGKLYVYHGGHWQNMYHAKYHAEKLGASVIYAHMHSVQSHPIQSIEGFHMAQSVGCLCQFKQHYLRGRPTNWSHNIAKVVVEGSGDFHTTVYNIINGKIFIGGKMLRHSRMEVKCPRHKSEFTMDQLGYEIQWTNKR